MYGVVRESAKTCQRLSRREDLGNGELTRQIGPFYKVGSYDAHQASHANQAAQSEDARQHELLTCFKIQPPDHIQRHTQHDNVKCHIR